MCCFLYFLILWDFFRSSITLYKMRYCLCELFYHLSVKNCQENSSLPSYVTSTIKNSAAQSSGFYFFMVEMKPSGFRFMARSAASYGVAVLHAPTGALHKTAWRWSSSIAFRYEAFSASLQIWSTPLTLRMMKNEKWELCLQIFLVYAILFSGKENPHGKNFK